MERPTWKPGDTLRSMYAVATVLGGAAIDSVLSRIDTRYADRINPPDEIEYTRATIGIVESPAATEDDLLEQQL